MLFRRLFSKRFPDLIRAEPSIITIPQDMRVERMMVNALEALQRQGIPCGFFNRHVSDAFRSALKSVKGQRFEVLTHLFGRAWTLEEGYALQRAHGCDGNAALLLAWITQLENIGSYAIIIHTGERLPDALAFEPSLHCVEQDRLFSLYHTGYWDGHVALVTFKALRI